MAADTYLIERISNILSRRKVDPSGKKMFGGYCWMVDDKMCFGHFRGGLMARVGPEALEELAEREGAEQMINGSRPMKGFLWIDPSGYDLEEDLEFWIDRCLAFNPFAKASKKKR